MVITNGPQSVSPLTDFTPLIDRNGYPGIFGRPRKLVIDTVLRADEGLLSVLF